MTMTDTSARPSTRLLSGAAGITWVLGVTLVATQADTDPVGSGYDAANRSLTPALALLTASAVSLWRQRRGRAIGACAVGFALALAGNVMEFWVLWAAGGTTDAMATRAGSEGSLLSTIGFGFFAVGLLVQLGGGIARATRPSSTPAARLAAPVAGLALTAGTGLWAIGPAPAAVAAAVGALAWWVAALDT